MIPAKHTWFHVRFFRWYSHYRIKWNFSSVSVHGEIPDTTGKPLLVIGNHFSWWDGFFILWLNNRYFRKEFHVMMLEDQLRANMILNKTGAFSIKKGSRDAVTSLAYAREILCGQTPVPPPSVSPLLLMYPQGEIQSMHTRPLKFEKGIEQVTRGLEGKINILLVVALVDYFSSQKPQLHFYLEIYPFNRELRTPDLENSFNQLLNRSMEAQVNIASLHQESMSSPENI